MSDPNAAPSTPVSPSAEAARDRLLGLGLVGASFIVALGLSWRSKEAVEPRVASQPAAPSSEGITGFPDAVAPLSLIERARALSEREQLVGIALSSVKSDATLDVANGARARFVFRSADGEGPEPPREYGTLPDKRYCGFQVVTLDASGLGALADVSDADCRRAVEPLPAPQCSLQAVWDAGKQRGADPGAVATVDYYRSNAGPAWYFQSGSVTLFLGADCVQELTPEQGRGVAGSHVPG